MDGRDGVRGEEWEGVRAAVGGCEGRSGKGGYSSDSAVQTYLVHACLQTVSSSSSGVAMLR